MEKKCNKCGDCKSSDNFYKDKRNRDGFVGICKICMSRSTRIYYNSNKQKVLEKKHISNKTYRQTEAGKKTRYRYQAKRYKNDEVYRLHTLVGTAISNAIRRDGSVKDKRTVQLLGCTIEELKQHLQSKFQDGMNWENCGKNGWEIDHIKPVSLFNLKDPAEQKQCFHYTNLQPLWRIDNLKKSNRYDKQY